MERQYKIVLNKQINKTFGSKVNRRETPDLLPDNQLLGAVVDEFYIPLSYWKFHQIDLQFPDIQQKASTYFLARFVRVQQPVRVGGSQGFISTGMDIQCLVQMQASQWFFF